jgi:2-dehydropantoate 2-reductase
VKIAVFGAGGVGAFYGGLLARAGQDVRVVARGAQLEALRTRGLRIESLALGAIVIPPMRAAGDASDIGPVDLVLIAVKAHQTAGILEQLAPLVGRDTLLMALQNGVESDDVLAARFGAERVLSAVVYVGATLEEPGLVRHVAAGTLVIGRRAAGPITRSRGSSDPVDESSVLRIDASLERVRDALASTGLPVRVSPDIERQRWHKLAWNASFNAVSALTLRSTQDLLGSAPSRELLTGVMREVIAVANARGIALGEADLEQLVSATEKAAPIRTSMLVDRERGRPMETDALVGVVVRKGREHGVPTPIASVLYALLMAIDLPQADTPYLPPMEAGSFSPQR